MVLLPVPVQVPSQMPLAPSVAQSRRSTINKGDNEMIPGAVQRSPGIYLTAEEKPGKPQLGDSRRRLCDQSSPQMGSLTSK